MHHFSSISNRFLTLNSTLFSDPCYGTQTFITIVTKSHEVIPYFSDFNVYLFRLSFNIIITSTCRLRCILAPWSIHHEGENDKSIRHNLPVLKYILILWANYTFWTYERGFRFFFLYKTDTAEVIICLRRQHCQLQSHPTRMWSNNRNHLH